jgi:MraZ protein
METLGTSYTHSFAHSFDEKGRVTVPSEWRETPFESRLYVFPTGEKHLRVYTATWLAAKQGDLMARDFDDPKRRMFEDLMTQVQPVGFDTQGRIMVKEKLRKAEGLNRDVTLVGRGVYFQIWDRKVWESKEIEQPRFADAARALGL